MGEMIERVARAITVAEGDDPDGGTGSLLNEGEVWWQHRIPQARAAIEAMREPTKEISAMSYCADNAENLWPAMIDAALK